MSDRTEQVLNSTNALPRLAPVLNGDAVQMNEYLRRSRVESARVAGEPLPSMAPGAGRLIAAFEGLARAAAQYPGQGGVPVEVTIDGHTMAFTLGQEPADITAIWTERTARSIASRAELAREVTAAVTKPTFALIQGGAR